MSKPVVPATVEPKEFDYLEPGLYPFTISNLEAGTKTDTSGNPSIIFTVESNGVEYKEYFYYADKLKNPNAKCKSEFLLSKFKIAFGMEYGKAYSAEQIIGMKAWGVVAKQLMFHDKNHTEPVMKEGEANEQLSFTGVNKNYFPWNNGVKPKIMGDPDNGEIGGIFIEKRKYTAKSNSNSSSSNAVQTPTGGDDPLNAGEQPSEEDDF